jgi:hypothetical protein
MTGSRFWDRFFRALYRLIRILDPAIRLVRRLVPIATIEELRVQGRSSGRQRRVLVTILSVAGQSYAGHPNGTRAAWVRNLLADGRATIAYRDGRQVEVRTSLVPGGPERAAVLRANYRQQPFPANVIYWLARRHIDVVGMYFRLERIPS